MTPGDLDSKETLAASYAPLHQVLRKGSRPTRVIVTLAVMISLVVILVLILVKPIQASVLAFELPWWTIDGGGGNSQGSSYIISGSIGQPDAGAAQGGSYSLAEGFWSAAPSVIVPEMYGILLPLVQK